MKIILFKLVFAFLGFELARIVGENPAYGLLIGGILGHLLDHKAGTAFAQWQFERVHLAKAKAEFEKELVSSLFFMFGHICGSDGAICKDEITEVEHMMTEVFNLNRAGRKRAIKVFKSARTSSQSFQEAAFSYFQLYKEHPDILEGTVAMFFRLANADGSVNNHEEKLIHTAASIFGVNKAKYSILGRQFMSSNGSATSIDQSYKVLGVTPTASDSELKSSYRKLVSEYHPDKIVSKDLPEEFIRFANQKMKDIQEAYETVKAQRGLS